jgi:hypothetical protein
MQRRIMLPCCLVAGVAGAVEGEVAQRGELGLDAADELSHVVTITSDGSWPWWK